MASRRRAAPKVAVGVVGITLASAFLLLLALIQPSGCPMDLDVALDQSRGAILHQSAAPASDRCSAYQAHMALLESKKQCVTPRNLPSRSSELAAYEQLITKTCG